MFKASTQLRRAPMARSIVKINDDVAPSRGRRTKRGRFGEPTYRDPRFPTCEIEALSGPGISQQ